MAAQQSSPLARLLSLGFFILVFGSGLWLYTPGVLRDGSAGQTRLIPAFGMRLTDASCKSALFVVSFCSVSYKTSVATLDKTIRYMVLGTAGGERVRLMQRLDTGEVVTDFGVASYKRRVGALAASVLMILFLIVAQVMHQRRLAALAGPTARVVPQSPHPASPERPGGLPTHSTMPNRVPRTFGQRRA